MELFLLLGLGVVGLEGEDRILDDASDFRWDMYFGCKYSVGMDISDVSIVILSDVGLWLKSGFSAGLENENLELVGDAQ
jgi:hypothetical protein